MRTDIYGQLILNETDLCHIFLQDPTRTVKNAFVEEPVEFSGFLSIENIPDLKVYTDLGIALDEFDEQRQSQWLFPKEYKDMDIAKWILEQCTSESELQRAGEELLLFQDRDMFILLKYLKYLVDTMRDNNIVWGVGRGSSVASFVLFLIGVHRINSLYYDLSIDEFLK
jgi:DNA polymerase III alpha subunit